MIERACRIIEPYMATVKYEVIREDGREREQVRERNGCEDVQYEPRVRAMRWAVLGGACMTPSALVMGRMSNSVKILQRLVTAKRQIPDRFAFARGS